MNQPAWQVDHSLPIPRPSGYPDGVWPWGPWSESRMNTALLEAWVARDRSRSARIEHEFGVADQCWIVFLFADGKPIVEAAEIPNVYRERPPDVARVSVPWEGKGAGWPGLAAVIEIAVRKAGELGYD